MTTLQVRDVDARDHEALKAAAAARGVSLQVYIAGVLHQHAVGEHNRRMLAEHEQRLHTLAGDIEPVTNDQVLAATRGARQERLAHTSSLIRDSAAAS